MSDLGSHCPMVIVLGVLTLFGGLRRVGLPLLVLGAATIAVPNGGDWMPDWRLLVPYLPVLVLGAIPGFCAVYRARARRSLARLMASVVVGLASVIAAGLVVRCAATATWVVGPSVAPQLPAGFYSQVGARLRLVLSSEHRVTAEAIGRISFEMPVTRFHDFLGLCDATIAHRGDRVPRWGRIDLAYTVDEVRPDVVLLHSGYRWLRPMRAASKNRMAGYSLFALGRHVNLDGAFVVLAVRGTVRATLAALEPLGIQAIPAPD